MTSSAASKEEARVVIAGAGIGGLVLALALRKHCGLAGSDIEVYEQAPAFGDGVGGGMGLYANGLRVLQDIDPALLATVRSYGYDYLYRRWLRHDGTEVACAHEKELCSDSQLQSLGIRRWKLQKALCDASSAAGINIRFGMRTEAVSPRTDGKEGLTVAFANGISRNARVVFGADGLKSKVREAVVGPMSADFTGVTCLMGASAVPFPVRGICFPSSSTTKSHACYYPSGDNETVFQLYFPAKTIGEDWGPQSADAWKKQQAELVDKLRSDGWDEDFIKPILAADSVIRVGIFSKPPLDTWVGTGARVMLLGDAAHPPVPYIGQGAMMAMEDVGVLVRCLKHYCCKGGSFEDSTANLEAAAAVYQALRIPRTRKVLGSSHTLGKTQQRRAESWVYNLKREWSIRLQVAIYGTLPIMKPGAAYDFSSDTARAIEEAGSDPAATLASALAAAKTPPEPSPPDRPLMQFAVVAGAAAAVFTIARSRRTA